MEQTNTVVKEKKVLKKRQKDMIFVACLVFLPLIHYALFYVYVNINSIVIAFQTYDVASDSYAWNNFANFTRLYKEFIREGFLLTSLRNSLLYYVINTAISTTACLFFSYYIFKKRFASKLFKTMLFLPSIISSIALTLMFKYFADYAIPKVLLEVFGKEVPPLISDKLTKLGMVIFYGIWMGFGTSLLMYSGAMSNISDSVIEAAQIDGAGEFRQFFNVVLPLIYPTLTTFLVNGVAVIFSSDMHLFAFFGTNADKYVYTFGYYLLRLVKKAGGSETGYGYPAAVGLILTAVSVPLTFAFRWALNKFGPKTV